VLLSVIEVLWQRSGPYLASLIRHLLSVSETPSNFALLHHYELLATLGKRDSLGARNAMKVDIMESARWYSESNLVENPPDNRRRRRLGEGQAPVSVVALQTKGEVSP
jgi:DNA-binding GntR family transcriptional regulator